MSRSQGSCGASLDCGFTGEGVAGRDRAQHMCRKLSRPSIRPGSGMIRFGGGVANIQEFWTFDAVRIGEVVEGLTVAIITGNLPLLLGDRALANFDLRIGGSSRAIEQAGLTLGRYEPGEIPLVQLEQAPATEVNRETSARLDSGNHTQESGDCYLAERLIKHVGLIGEHDASADASRWTREQITKYHNTNHAPLSRMITFLQTIAKTTLTNKETQLVTEVVQGCKACQVSDSRKSRGHGGVPAIRSWLELGWIDLFLVATVAQTQIWGLGCIDDGTGEIALHLTDGTTAEDVFGAYEERWATIRGFHKQLVSDPDGACLSVPFRQLCDLNGMEKVVTPGKSSESHGKIERVFRTVRWSLDRLRNDTRTKDWTRIEWKRALHRIENEIRNEVVRVGSGDFISTASLRATGRTSTIHNNLLNDNLATASSVDGFLGEIEEITLQVYRETLYGQRAREILAHRITRTPHQPELGDKVMFCRQASKGRSGGVRGVKWWGPGIVTGVQCGDIRYIRVDHGGIDYLCHPLDVVDYKTDLPRGAAEDENANDNDLNLNPFVEHQSKTDLNLKDPFVDGQEPSKVMRLPPEDSRGTPLLASPKRFAKQLVDVVSGTAPPKGAGSLLLPEGWQTKMKNCNSCRRLCQGLEPKKKHTCSLSQSRTARKESVSWNARTLRKWPWPHANSLN